MGACWRADRCCPCLQRSLWMRGKGLTMGTGEPSTGSLVVSTADKTQGTWLASEGRLLGGGSMLSWWTGYGLSEKVIKDDAKILAWFGGECTRQLFSLLYVQLITYWQTWLLAKNRNRNTLNDSLEMEKHGFSSLIFDLLLVLFEQLEFPFW